MLWAETIEHKFEKKYKGLLMHIASHNPQDVLQSAHLAIEWLKENRLDIDRWLFDNFELMHGCALWSAHRTVYRIDGTLMQELTEAVKEQDGSETLPSNLLLNLPFPAIAVEAIPIVLTVRSPKTQEVAAELKLSGNAFITAQPEPDSLGYKSLMGVWERIEDKEDTFTSVLPIIPDMTVKEAFKAHFDHLDIMHTDENISFDDRFDQTRLIPSITAQIVLYLQAANADIPKPATKKANKAAHGKASRKPVTEVPVGFRVGKTIRLAKQAAQTKEPAARSGGGLGTAKAPHVRRAHWHSYWTGSMSAPDQRKMIVKWISATAVGQGDILPVVKKVK